MKFSLNVWYQYRSKAAILGEHIQSYKDKKGIIRLEKETLEGYIAHITCLLKECSNYMEKCDLNSPSPLWKFKLKDPTTHPSSIAFLYKDKMTEKQIKEYGDKFMSLPLKEENEAA